MSFLRRSAERATVSILALAVALALVWATPGVAHADDPPSATFHLTSRVATLTTEDGEPITATIISTVVNLDFGDALLAAGIGPSSITVTVMASRWTTPSTPSRSTTGA